MIIIQFNNKVITTLVSQLNKVTQWFLEGKNIHVKTNYNNKIHGAKNIIIIFINISSDSKFKQIFGRYYGLGFCQ